MRFIEIPLKKLSLYFLTGTLIISIYQIPFASEASPLLCPSLRPRLEYEDQSLVQKLLGIKVPKSLPLAHGNAPRSFFESGSIKVVIWNIYKGIRQQDLSHQLPEVAENSDILMFQETALLAESGTVESSQNHILSQMTNFDWHTAPGFVTKAGVHYGVSTASRVRARTATAVKSDWREPFLGTPKMALLTEYPMQNFS